MDIDPGASSSYHSHISCESQLCVRLQEIWGTYMPGANMQNYSRAKLVY